MSNEYKNNHYVPVWYQKKFLFPNHRDNELYYLNLNPDSFTDPTVRYFPILPLVTAVIDNF